MTPQSSKNKIFMENENTHRGCPLKLTPHFTLEELTRSAVAQRHGMDNTPSPEVVHNLRLLCTKVLELLRREFGPIRVTSGYRCEWLNRAVGGATHSQHLFGQACDLHIPSHERGIEMMEFIFMTLPFDQLLMEHSLEGAEWIHVSYNEHHNRQIMIPYYVVH